MAITYVQLTREDFEQWLNTTHFHGKWFLKPGTVGVYTLPVSDNVAVEISSSVGSENEVLDRGNASIQMRLVSLITKRVINKKAQGQSHFKRTINWRDTLKKALDNFVSTYNKAASFYEAIATIQDRDKYKADIISKIESFPNWQQDQYLSNLHKRMDENGVLMLPELDALNNYKPKEQGGPAPSSHIPQQHGGGAKGDPNFLERLRTLYKAARAGGDDWLMKFVESVGKQYAARGTLSDKQMAIIEKGLQKFKIAKVKQQEIMAHCRLLVAASNSITADDKSLLANLNNFFKAGKEKGWDGIASAQDFNRKYSCFWCRLPKAADDKNADLRKAAINHGGLLTKALEGSIGKHPRVANVKFVERDGVMGIVASYRK